MVDISNRLPRSFTWLLAGGAYLGFTFVGHLFWEIVQLPLYTIWTTGTPRELAFAVIHCTLGDILIALSTLVIALTITGGRGWPRVRFWQVTSFAIGLGIIYTAYSEWLNVTVRATWAYSESMPIISLFGLNIGLSPIVQWVIVPGFAFLKTRKVFDVDYSNDPVRN